MSTGATNRTRPDWAGTLQTYVLVWGLPIAAILVGLFLDVRLRTPIWMTALGLMGTACLLNARRCGRIHCRYTGPFYFGMILPVLIVGVGFMPIGSYGWIILAAVIILGGKLIWWATERAWGKFT
ncbi:MAG: hypothetical protein BroJett024_20940 [Alphaproteobacteria bacterium]|nr:MAG: hypothetical protein BroJett024_20940 [Alphaproteobacteria bacterium]